MHVDVETPRRPSVAGEGKGEGKAVQRVENRGYVSRVHINKACVSKVSINRVYIDRVYINKVYTRFNEYESWGHVLAG